MTELKNGLLREIDVWMDFCVFDPIKFAGKIIPAPNDVWEYRVMVAGIRTIREMAEACARFVRKDH